VGHRGWEAGQKKRIVSVRGTHLKGKTRPEVRWHHDGVIEIEMSLARACRDWFCRIFRLSVPAVVGGVVAEVRTGQNMKNNMRMIWGCSLRIVRRVVHICKLADELSDLHRSGEWAARLSKEGVDLMATRVEGGRMEARQVRGEDESEQVVVVEYVVLATAPS